MVDQWCEAFDWAPNIPCGGRVEASFCDAHTSWLLRRLSDRAWPETAVTVVPADEQIAPIAKKLTAAQRIARQKAAAKQREKRAQQRGS